MRRRRKTKYHWLFNAGTSGPTGSEGDTVNGRDLGQMAIEEDGTSSYTVIPLLLDTPTDVAAKTDPFVVTDQTDYFIKRIVGKIFVNQSQTADGSGSILFGAGLFIARESEVQSGLPVGINATQGVFSTAAEPFEGYGPLNVDPIREPWIWRRVWVLSNRLSTDPTQVTSFPATNADYGSVLDGPHIDAKTARRVRDDERLFLMVQARNFPVNGTTASNNKAIVSSYIDYRILGARRKHRQQSAF